MDEGVDASNSRQRAAGDRIGVDPADVDRVEVNGESRPLPSATSVQALLMELGLAGKRVAVALNRSVVPRSHYNETLVSAGDRIEILEAVGGG